MGTPTQRIEEAFWIWEERCRGYKTWPAFVRPEPYYVPFPDPKEILPKPQSDSGRVQSPESKLVRFFKGKDALGSSENNLLSLDYPEEPPNSIKEIRDVPIEFEIQLPVDFNTSSQAFEQFLHSISRLTYCSSIEIIASADEISLFLTADRQHGDAIRADLENRFPEISIIPHQDHLIDKWLETDPNDSIIVELGLGKEVHTSLPLEWTAGNDPLTTLYSVMDTLMDGDLVIFQIIFTKAIYPWADALVDSINTDGTNPLHPNFDFLVNSTKDKVSKPLFGVVMRIAVRHENIERREYLARKMISALSVSNQTGQNYLVPLDSSEIDDTDHTLDLIFRTSHRSGMVLNSAELASLAHFPSKAINTPKLSRLSTNTKEFSGSLQTGLLLGENTHRNETKEVYLSDEDRTRHMYVIGGTGSGKSTLIQNCIIQDMQNGKGLCLIDPHGDLCDKVIEHVPEHRLDDVILIDPSDENVSIAFNILSAHSEIEKTLLASDLTSTIRRFASTSWGDQMTAVLDNAILAVLNHPQGGTLLDIQRLLVEKEFRKQFVSEITDSYVAYFWQNEFPSIQGRPQTSILTRLSTFLRPKSIRHMMAQKDNKLDLAEIMDGNKILLVKLSQGLIGEDNSHLLGALIVTKINQIIMARQSMEAADRELFFLYIDEVHNFATDSMSKILSGARKYQLGLIVAHQELKQLEVRDPELASSILSNPYARICFNLGDRDAKRLANGFSSFDPVDLQNLPVGKAIARIGRADNDFNLDSPPPPHPPGNFSKNLKRIKENTATLYGTPTHEVEEQLRMKYQQSAKKPQAAVSKPYVEVAKPVTPQQKTPPEPLPPEKDMEPYTPPPAAKPTDPVNKKKLLGRGGENHRALQDRIKTLGESYSYRAEVECPTPKGGAIDVSLQKQNFKIAVEISETTPVAYEVKNIRKCIDCKYDLVIMTSPNSNHLKSIKSKVRQTFAEQDIQKVVFISPDEIKDHISSLEARFASGSTIQAGWTLKTLYTPIEELSEEDVSARQAKFKLMAESQRRNLNNEKPK